MPLTQTPSDLPECQGFDNDPDFCEGLAIAELLQEDVVFVQGTPSWCKGLCTIFVNCNDLFAWACADCEELPVEEIANLYRMVKADPAWGDSKWCCIRRNMQPQAPIVQDMKRDGAWDEVMESLPPNPYEKQ